MSKSWERADFWPGEPRAATVDEYARGLADGRAAVETELAGERAALLELAVALDTLAPPSPGLLATMMVEAVERLVIDIAGSAPVDAGLLAERAEALTAVVADEAGVVLAAHPDDAALLAGACPVLADPSLPRGTIEARTAQGHFEDGVRPALARLRAEIDRLGLAA